MISIIDHNGVERFMGNNPQAAPKFKWAVYGDTPETPMLTRDQWKPCSLAQWTPPIKDQDGIGACNAFDTVSVIEACRAQEGLEYVKLSPGYLYGNINGQQDNGSMLEDALQWMISHGTVPALLVGELDWRQSQWPNTAAEAAKPFRMVEAYWCPTFDHLASALQQGFFVSDGVDWYPNFTPDGDGWLPAAGRGRSGGHALMRDGLAFRNGKWGADGPNSWGTSWGAQGRMVMPESIHSTGIGGWWAIRGTIEGGGGVPAPK